MTFNHRKYGYIVPIRVSICNLHCFSLVFSNIAIFIITWWSHRANDGSILPADDTNHDHVRLLGCWSKWLSILFNNCCWSFRLPAILFFELFYFQVVKLEIERWFLPNSVTVYMIKWVGITICWKQTDLNVFLVSSLYHYQLFW